MIKKLLLLFLICTVMPINVFAEPAPEIQSGCAVMIDATTGQVLYNKNMNEKAYPASITKIMTAMLAVENGNLNDIVEVSKNAAFSIERGSSHVGLVPGEQITLDQALHAVLLMSANEASNALAEYVSGTVEDFATLMNKKAKELGAVNTNFVNPHGLHNDNHYTTAYDMALITKYAITLPTFLKIFGTVKYEVPPTNLQVETRYFANNHKMLKNTSVYYEDVIGGKTGYTTKSGHTLVTVANKDGRELIVVVLKSTKDGLYKDTKTLLDFGFSNYKTYNYNANDFSEQSVDIYNQGKVVGTANVSLKKDFTCLIPNEVDANSIVIDINIPKTILLGANVSPSISFSIANEISYMESNLGTVPLDVIYNYNKKGQALIKEENSITNTESNKDIPTNKNRIIISAITILIMLSCCIKIYIDDEKRKRRLNRFRRRSKHLKDSNIK